MIEKEALTLYPRAARVRKPNWEFLSRWREIPWWVGAMAAIILLTFWMIGSNPNFNSAFHFIKVGITVTIFTTLVSFAIAIVIGLASSMARISNNVFLKNFSTLYIELIRGIPMLVLIFFIAFVGIPGMVNAISSLGDWLSSIGLTAIGNHLISMRNSSVPMNARAIIALAITYGAYSSEIFRAGIQSVPKGQMEAARAQGMTYAQAMRFIILPQAFRNILPALGNDFIAMLKDSSLVSILAVRDITQIARLYAGKTFQFRESYLILSILYLVMTLLLSFLIKRIEKRLNQPGHN